MDIQERMDRIEDRNAATMAKGLVQEPLQLQKERVLTRLIALYRTGETRAELYYGGVAELAALDALMYSLDNIIRQGNVAAAEEYK